MRSEARFHVSPARMRRRRIVNAIVGNPYVLLAPTIILMAVFDFRSLFFVIQKSFMKYDMVEGIAKYIGFTNYVNNFTNPVFLRTMGNSLIYVFIYVLGGLVLGLLAGIFLNKRGAIYEFTQSVIYSPAIIPSVSGAIMWMLVMDPRTGLANSLLQSLGMEPLQWFKGESTSLLAVMITALWGVLGYNSLLIIAGLQNIPNFIYESAKLDRARGSTMLRKIVFPLLSPTLFFLFITKTIEGFSTFDNVQLMTGGGPNNSSNVLAHWIYQTGFLFFRIGPAMAASVVFMVIVGTISLLNYTAFGRRVHYQ